MSRAMLNNNHIHQMVASTYEQQFAIKLEKAYICFFLFRLINEAILRRLFLVNVHLLFICGLESWQSLMARMIESVRNYACSLV